MLTFYIWYLTMSLIFGITVCSFPNYKKLFYGVPSYVMVVTTGIVSLLWPFYLLFIFGRTIKKLLTK